MPDKTVLPADRLPIPKLGDDKPPKPSPQTITGSQPKPKKDPLERLPTRLSDLPAPPVPLRDIEWRIDSKPYERDGKQVARYVGYLNAAIIADLFDQWAGPGNWWDSYGPGELNGHPVLWCEITVRFPWGEITKMDIGVAPKGEADLSDKGMVSDAFKRCACLKWGVGRNIYRVPTLWADCRVDQGGRAWPADSAADILVRKLAAAGWREDGTRD